ncbi:hypothetical protein CY35_10G078500 [Sphagnum magellanicum]|nr:hypothetical protein CY35_10G078500 [Sphagnum magellanicum]
MLKLVKQANWKKLDFDLLMEGVIECNPHKEVRTAGKLKPAAKATPLSKEEVNRL